MFLRRLRLHHRIVVPFVLIAIVIPAVAAFVALSLVVRSLESRVATQILNTAAVVSRSDFALNPTILARVKDLTGANVVTYTAGGTVLATTLDPHAGAVLAATATTRDATREVLAAEEGTTVLRHATCGGAPCNLAYRRVSTRPDTVVALVVDTSELDAVTVVITRTILLSAVLSVLVMTFVSQIVARRVSGPLERLVAFTRDVSPGVSLSRAVVGEDEVGRLAGAFNQMLDRVDLAQGALVRSEKLAVTGLLAARVAHDIRNPLSSIKMQTQLLLQSRMSAEQGTPLLHAVLRDIDQVESVVRDLLELARPGDLKVTPTQLNEVLGDLLKQLAPQLGHRKIAVVSALAEALPPLLLDPARFKQAVANVIVNAADAMPQGGTLRVATWATDAGSTLVVEVCDDGEGVPAELLDRVFDPFVSTKHEGVGLGLVNAKAVVESHGGRIALAPGQPSGTRVTMWLPVGLGHANGRHGVSSG